MNFNKPIDHLPPACTHFSLLNRDFDQIIGNLPVSLTHLTTSSKLISCLQPSLNSLIHLDVTVTLHNPHTILAALLKPNLAKLKLLHVRIRSLLLQTPLDQLAKSITHLDLRCLHFDQPLDHLPNSLQKLSIFSDDFNHTLDHLPSSLTFLLVNGESFNRPLNQLPCGLTHLAVGPNFNRPLANLPPHLTHLCLAPNYKHILADFPLSLQVLSLPHGCFPQSYPKFPSLTHLLCNSESGQSLVLPLFPLLQFFQLRKFEYKGSIYTARTLIQLNLQEHTMRTNLDKTPECQECWWHLGWSRIVDAGVVVRERCYC